MLSPEEKKAWEARVADYRKSGMSARRWCEEHGVTVHQLKYWGKRFEKPSVSQNISGWTPVEIVDQAGGGATMTIHLSKIRIEVQAGFDTVALTEALRVVAASC